MAITYNKQVDRHRSGGIENHDSFTWICHPIITSQYDESAFGENSFIGNGWGGGGGRVYYVSELLFLKDRVGRSGLDFTLAHLNQHGFLSIV